MMCALHVVLCVHCFTKQTHRTILQLPDIIPTNLDTIGIRIRSPHNKQSKHDNKGIIPKDREHDDRGPSLAEEPEEEGHEPSVGITAAEVEVLFRVGFGEGPAVYDGHYELEDSLF